ncbi:MAG: CoB--CoM heterodisulfide reductase iron-sulfur subunit A family protein [Candidatus Bathyarchaeia archaeon]
MSEEPRIGVFVCQCGINIGGVVTVPAVVEYAKTLPHVHHAEENIYTCSEAGVNVIKEAIKQHNLNRVVVASCTPRTHESLFRAVCEEAGLNKYLFEMANIREQCSWVHSSEPEKATQKARDIVRMAVARANLLESLSEPEVEIGGDALVVGGGISGLTAANTLASQGFKVYVVEKEAELGGLLRQIHKVYPTFQHTPEVWEPVEKSARQNDNIEILTSTNIKDVNGYVGNFKVAVEVDGKGRTLDIGTIIVASGALNYVPPQGSYQYGVYPNVLTQLQLEENLRNHSLKNPNHVVMIQCVGSRVGEIWTYELMDPAKSFAGHLLKKILGAAKEEGWPYCSKICCMNAIKNAILLKNRWPDCDVTILYSDIRTYKEYEDFYRKARELEVKFLKYIREIPPEITDAGDGRLNVRVYDTLAGVETDFLCGLLILSTPLIPSKEDVVLARQLKVPLGADGFFMEAHPKLRPVDTQTDGIFVAGTASGPKDIAESVISAKAAAARAGTLMGNKKMKTEALMSVVNKNLCIGCGLCEELCPYGAHRVEGGKSTTVAALCRGCGVCAVDCPQHAITMSHYTDDQVTAQIKAALVTVEV